MTLKDFFTLTELKDGLTNPARINDLITIMQNEKENTVQNISETTQQWSAVATTLAITENKECLELFIKLDGLLFIDKWLNDAQKFVNDDGEKGFLEELMISLLRAIERLEVDNRVSVGLGIGKTVQGLVGHGSLVVREKAKALSDRWAPDEVPADVNSVANDEEVNVEQTVCSASDTVQQEIDKEEIPKQEIVTESETETIKEENENSKSEITGLTVVSSVLEDASEKQETEPLDKEGAVELTTLTSSTDIDHALESVTKIEITEDTSNKDEEMVDGEEKPADDRDTTMEFNTTSGFHESPEAGGGGDENPKSTSNSESDSDEDVKKDSAIQSSGSSHSHLDSKRSMKGPEDLISNRPSDMDLDYGMVDPLELARQVAIEVEREIDSQEQSCSTSTNGNEPQSKSKSTVGPGKEVSSALALAPEPEPEPTQISDMVQESAPHTEKGFDLNQEFSSDETETVTEGPVDPILTPISVVSASRAAAANGLPVAPLQFEGALGWKGSAATSAFRRIPEGEKTFSSSSSHNQRLNRLDFDLNVTEDSGDKLERLQLDLNSLGDGDAGIISLDWKRDTRVASLRQNGPQSPSVSSSSSSMQPSFRNIDLNLNDHSDNPFLGKLFNNKRERERDESVISLFGTQVEVNRNEYIPPPTPTHHQNQNHHPHLQQQPNGGRILEPSVDFSLGRPGSGLRLESSMPYANLPAYGYGHNGFAVGPMYGHGPPGAPIPYMVPSIPPSFSQPTQPFIFNMAAPSGSNGAGPSRSNFDLNSGFMTEMGNRENNGGLRQFFNHNHSQASSSSVIGGKREEPDSGWELFPMNYKHQQPPWQ